MSPVMILAMQCNHDNNTDDDTQKKREENLTFAFILSGKCNSTQLSIYSLTHSKGGRSLNNPHKGQKCIHQLLWKETRILRMLANDGRPNNAHVTKYDDNSCQAKITSRALWGYSETELRALSWVLSGPARTHAACEGCVREEGGRGNWWNKPVCRIYCSCLHKLATPHCCSDAAVSRQRIMSVWES